MFVGWLDEAGTPVNRLVKEWQVALPLHREFGTEPNVYYVPPLSPHPLNEDMSIDTERPRIPPEYLEYLFGADLAGRNGQGQGRRQLRAYEDAYRVQVAGTAGTV